MLIDTDKLIATLDANDDDIEIDRHELIRLMAKHLEESFIPKVIAEFFFSYEICPLHKCDIEICEDDENEECEQIRSDYRNDEGIFSNDNQ